MFAEALALPASLDREQVSGGRRAPQKPMNEAQFEAFYRKTAGSLWSYIYRMTGDPATADDLLQKTFLGFLRANPTFESDEHARRYAFRAATNLALDHFRESKRDRLRLDSLTPRSATVADRGELRHDVSRLFGELKPRERALLWLAHVEEAGHDEIGEALGVKSASVRVLLFRARKRLAELLSKAGIGPEVTR
ncbi:MAG TPA: sigma-70 family RNA polymerase sigma factor [Thermoanaerobaculia bacterium]|jgi:RNA polymerase sigma-70 factor (ECF subfamily)|nr:sigma-70 family RNA polymerase sigma factor [Thermoanaerobaculia bacterium]